MFTGQAGHTIDDKGRLTIPVKFRDPLVDGGYLLRGLDGNLQLMTPRLFDRYYERINSMNAADPRTRTLRRLFLGTAERIEIDKAGRILIPQYLRDTCELAEDVMLVGQGEYIEIWSLPRWLEEQAALNDPSNEERLSTLDLSF